MCHFCIKFHGLIKGVFLYYAVCPSCGEMHDIYEAYSAEDE